MTGFAIVCFACVAFSINLFIFVLIKISKRVNSYEEVAKGKVKDIIQSGQENRIEEIFNTVRDCNDIKDKLARNKNGWIFAIVSFLLSGVFALAQGATGWVALQIAFWVLFVFAVVVFIFALVDLRSLGELKNEG